MGRLFIESLPDTQVYKCKCCKVDLALHEDISSKNFMCRHGKAYLFKTLVNVTIGPSEDRHLNTGLHTVNDVYCSSCQQILGWRYDEFAYNNNVHSTTSYSPFQIVTAYSASTVLDMDPIPHAFLVSISTEEFVVRIRDIHAFVWKHLEEANLKVQAARNVHRKVFLFFLARRYGYGL